MSKREHVSSYKYFKSTIENGEKKDYEVTKEFVDNVTLEDGTGILAIHGHTTMLNNYLATFWKAAFGMRDWIVYCALIKNTFSPDDNQSWYGRKALAEECGFKDVKTLDSSFSRLEELGFLDVYHVYDTESRTYKSNIYVIRKSTPWIPIDIYKKFPKSLKQRHDQYIHSLLNSKKVSVSDVPNYPVEEVKETKPAKKKKEPIPISVNENMGSGINPLPNEKYHQGSGINPPPYDNRYSDAHLEGSGFIPPLLIHNQNGVADETNYGSGINPPRVGDETDINKRTNSFNKNELEEKDYTSTYINVAQVEELIKIEMQTLIAESSYKTWFSGFKITAYTKERVYLKAGTPFAKDWIENHYKQHLMSILMKHSIPCTQIVFVEPNSLKDSGFLR